MGCDIHLYREKKINGIWVTADEWVDEYGEGLEVPYEDQFDERDYDLFGFLAGVRRDSDLSRKPTGIPFDVSENVKSCYLRWEDDAHSESSMTLESLKWNWANLSDKVTTVSGMKDTEGLNKLARSIMEKGDTDWDLIYPYCQGTNQHNFENFSIEVPCHFKLSRIEKLISLFDDIDAEECRIVFWFDN
jgi:hypothetical protein